MVRHRSLLQFFQLVAVAVVAILETKMVNQAALAAVAVMRQQERVGREIHRLEALHKGTMAVMVRLATVLVVVEVVREPQEQRLLQAHQQ